MTGPGGGGIHPIHTHQVNFYLCGRRNNVTGQSLFEYETYVPKDTFFLGASDEVRVRGLAGNVWAIVFGSRDGDNKHDVGKKCVRRKCGRQHTGSKAVGM